MKDHFRKEMKKVKADRSGDEGGELNVSKWPYFSLMQFLKEEVTTSKMSGNISRSETNDEESEWATINLDLDNSTDVR